MHSRSSCFGQGQVASLLSQVSLICMAYPSLLRSAPPQVCGQLQGVAGAAFDLPVPPCWCIACCSRYLEVAGRGKQTPSPLNPVRC